MGVARSGAEILADHAILELGSIGRPYLNVYVPRLQHELGGVSFFRFHRGRTSASPALMEPISAAVVAATGAFAAAQGAPVVPFAKGQREDDLARAHLARFTGEEGVLFVGQAQERTPVFRTEKRRHPQTGRTYARIVRSGALVNRYCFHRLDRDSGPFFLKVCPYFPDTAELCRNGHEDLKRQLAREGIAHAALDTGLLSCADPARAQAICDGLGAEQGEALLRKWLALLPHPFSAADRQAGYRYDVSALQAEFSLTRILDRPIAGRLFFEAVIRENLDIGRPDRAHLISARRVTKRTPGRFRTRVITDGVIPSLHVDSKSSRIEPYPKEGRGLRTETTITNPRDFALGKRLRNLPALRQVGFAADRRLLDVQRLSRGCAIGDAAFQRGSTPSGVGEQRAAALPSADPRVQALFAAPVLFCLHPRGFSNRDPRERLAPLLGLAPGAMTPGRMTYDLRRRRLHGLIERVPRTHRYRPTAEGWRTALFFTRTYARLLRPGLSHVMAPGPLGVAPRATPFTRLQEGVDQRCHAATLVA